MGKWYACLPQSIMIHRATLDADYHRHRNGGGGGGGGGRGGRRAITHPLLEVLRYYVFFR